MMEPRLTLEKICKSFPGVQALDHAQLEIMPGEVHCLLGENGAGKSTLMRVVGGIVKSDSGKMFLNGRPYHPETPRQAQSEGISIIHQELNLCAEMSVAENIMLGREPKRGRWPLIDHRKTKDTAIEVLSKVGLSIDVDQAIGTFSIAQQQMIEIAKALSFDAQVLVMDEPTTALTDREVRVLFKLIDDLRREGVTIIYISHRLEEILRIGDRATIMRDGMHIQTNAISNLDRDSIISAMVGRSLDEEFPSRQIQKGTEVVVVENLSRSDAFNDISLTVHRGELVGLTGLVGSGRTEIARALFGAEPANSGSISFDGKLVEIRTPKSAIALGIGLLPEDRKEQGFFAPLSVRENITLGNLPFFTKSKLVHRKTETDTTSEFIQKLSIRTPSGEQAVMNLSGGNQQKVVLAKWLVSNCSCLVFDEPTRGVDVGAKTEIYSLMNELLEQGVGILMISSDLPEVLGMSDRILVLREGKVAGEIPKTGIQSGKRHEARHRHMIRQTLCILTPGVLFSYLADPQPRKHV